MSQPQPPTLINLPPSGSDTPPSEAPGTPTSATTSLSALSTTATKDGHRGHINHDPLRRAHAHHPSTTSLEAERADRISRLAGLERMRAVPPHQPHGPASATAASSSLSPQSTPPVSTQIFPLNYPPSQALTPAYFDAQGQPVAAPTKLSTTGTVSATSAGGSRESDGTDETRTTTDGDDDMSATDAASMGPMMAGDAMDEDADGVGSRSVAGFEDRMSDDGNASLVGFGEGACSTVSGPIYQRRPGPQQPQPQQAGSQAGSGGGSATLAPAMPWSIDRLGSTGLGDIGMAAAMRRDRDGAAGSDTPASAAALQERREARMVDGVAADSAGVPPEEMFVDTTNRSPVSAGQMGQVGQNSINGVVGQVGQPVYAQGLTPLQQHRLIAQQQRMMDQQLQQQQQQPAQQPQPHNAHYNHPLGHHAHHHHQLPRAPLHPQSPSPANGSPSAAATREAAERILQGLDGGEGRLTPGSSALGSPGTTGRLGQFYFEDGKKRDT